MEGGITIADGTDAFAHPLSSFLVPRSTEDCADVPGAIVHDDGTAESAIGGYWETVSEAHFVDRFTPSFYPATFSAVCVGLSKTEPDPAPLGSFDFLLVAYDDDGVAGAPGTLLGSMPVHLDALPQYDFGVSGQYVRVDIASLDLDIEEGNVYLGVEWDPSAYPGVFTQINMDSSGGPPALGQMRLNDDPWSTLFTGYPPYLGFPDYTALQIRAIERSPQPKLLVAAADVVATDHCAFNPSSSNGVVEPGETVELAVPVFASGADFTDVTASLGLPAPPGVAYTTGSANLGAIADGERSIAQLAIQLDATAACLQDLHLPLVIESNEGDFAAALSVPVGQLAADVGPLDLPLKTNYDSSGLDSRIHIAQSAALSGLAVRVKLRHYSVQAVELLLTSPAGTTITLLDRPGYPPDPGCENALTEVLFVDGGPDPEGICATPPGGTPWPVSVAGPVQPLATFAGENMQGNWTLTVRDHWEVSVGALMDWELIPSPLLVDVCTPCDASADRIFQSGFE